jgi:hypothetical protein
LWSKVAEKYPDLYDEWYQQQSIESPPRSEEKATSNAESVPEGTAELLVSASKPKETKLDWSNVPTWMRKNKFPDMDLENEDTYGNQTYQDELGTIYVSAPEADDDNWFTHWGPKYHIRRLDRIIVEIKNGFEEDKDENEGEN